MARLYGACLGLVLFSGMIVCGVLADNSPEQVVLRAVIGLAGGFAVGATAGWIGMVIVRDNAAALGGDKKKTPGRVDAAGGPQAAASGKQAAGGGAA
jgi:hypothetical protein